MDADRFDSLARTLIAAGTRRRALAALLGGGLVPALGLVDAAAKKRKGKKGKKKKKKNGPGQCATATQACAGTGDCCGELVCGSEDRCCAPIPSACGSHAECCVGLCETDDEGRPRCCLPDGSVCNLGRLCCSGNCSGNSCAPSDPGSTCKDPGQVCEGTNECCGELICSQSVNECCAPLGGVCLSHADCCVGECQTDSDGEPRCCSLGGAFCNLGRECCSGVCFPDDTCAPAPCRDNGEDCEESDQCCGGLVCGKIFNDGCCVPPDGGCVEDSDCCQANNEEFACGFIDDTLRCCATPGSLCGVLADLDIRCCPGATCHFTNDGNRCE